MKRAAPRINLFVLAAVRSGHAVSPVRIRNVSPKGMLIEGGALPPVGSLVEIERGVLSASGSVVWLENGRAGVHVSGVVDVAKWLPNAMASRQSRIDEIVHKIKSGDSLAGCDSPAPAAAKYGDLVELDRLIGELSFVSQSLAEDTTVLDGHAENLQKLDIIVQRLKTFLQECPNSDQISTS